MFFFFFQAEDGIRDADVTGVQTCALPISLGGPDSDASPDRPPGLSARRARAGQVPNSVTMPSTANATITTAIRPRTSIHSPHACHHSACIAHFSDMRTAGREPGRVVGDSRQ